MSYVTPHVFDTAYPLTTSTGDELSSNLATTLGLTDLGDGDGGVFCWDASSLATDDGVDVIQPSSVAGSDPGRWLRVSGTPTGGGAFTGPITATSATTGVPAITGTATVGSARGVLGQGVGTSSGVYGIGGATGAGVSGAGGATSGTGVVGTGGPASYGGAFTGGTTGAGVLGQGGATNALGGYFNGGGTNGGGIYVDGRGTGIAGTFVARDAYGASIECDTTSPIKAALHLEPQDAVPSGPNVVGDTYYTLAGILRKCVVAGTPGTWSNVGVEGTATNDNAIAGNIGEIITATAALDSVGSWTTNTPQNICSISLTAGDWDVQGQIAWAGATTGTYTIACISTVSATLQGDEATQGYTATPFITQANSRLAQTTGPYRASLAATTTIYLVGQEGFTVGTPAVGGVLRARRMR